MHEPGDASRAAWARPEDLIGLELDDRYRLLEVIGAGGMGAVYEAEQIRLRKRIAIKVLSPRLATEEVHLKRFLREARAASSIRHKNVVDIMDFGEVPGGSAYFVMEYLEGQNLAQLLREQGKLPWERARGIVLQIVGALEAAHAKGIVHRDIKPANALLVDNHQEGTRDFVKVLDFGIAKLADSSPDTRGLTATDQVMGTVAYMAPEQAQGALVDHRTDIYSLGIMVYQMLTGRTPFEGPNSFAVLTHHVSTEPASMLGLDPTIPSAVDAIVLRCLRKQPDQRFQSMTELRVAIEPLEGLGRVSTGGYPSVAPSGPYPPVATQVYDRSSTSVDATAVLPDTGSSGTALVAPPLVDPLATPGREFVSRPLPVTSPSQGYPKTPPPRSKLWVGAGIAAILVVLCGAGIGAWLALGGESETPDDVARSSSSPADDPVAAPTPPDEPPDEPQPGESEPTEPQPGEPEPTEPQPSEPEPTEPTEPSPEVSPPSDESESEPTSQTDPPDDDPEPAQPKSSRRAPKKTKPLTDDRILANLRRSARRACRSKAAPGQTVKLTFLIRSDGSTGTISPRPPEDDGDVRRCIAKKILGTDFTDGGLRSESLEVRF